MLRTAVLVVGLVAGCAHNDDTTPVDRTAAPKTKAVTAESRVDASATAQTKRRELIQKLKNMGVIFKIEKLAQYPHVYVGQTFYTLDIDTKQSFVSTISAFYYVQDREATSVLLFDGRNGKQIGVYDKYGLSLD